MSIIEHESGLRSNESPKPEVNKFGHVHIGPELLAALVSGSPEEAEEAFRCIDAARNSVLDDNGLEAQ